MRTALIGLLLIAGCATPETTAQSASSHAELLDLYSEWRAFQVPPMTDGVADYSSSAMTRQYADLPAWQARLAAFDTTGWSVSDQIDWYLVRAEMNGLEFDHRVLEPWKNNPAFYIQVWTYQSDTPSHEGPTPYGFIDIWEYDYPLSEEAAAEFAGRIATIPPFLASARTNLTGNQRDLWRMGISVMADQRDDLQALGERVAGTSEALDAAIAAARDASDEMVSWLEGELESKTGPSGIGEANYDWYMRHVHLSPYGWKDELRIMEAELARSFNNLRLEENRNRDLPAQRPIDNEDDYYRLGNQAVDDFLEFWESNDIVEMKPYMEPALRARVGTWNPNEPSSFFQQVIYRDPLVMQTHWYHWIDLQRMAREPHPSPIRANPLLYNIWDSRSEGMATGMEEMMMHAGYVDGNPRSRELVWILVAQRAARAIAGLRMHSNEWTLQQASDFAVAWTPRGWMQPNGDLVGFEQHLYLQQPGYGSSYLAGKAQIERLLSEWSHVEGDAFTIRRFMDAVNDAGMIPVPLIQWEMTGTKPAFLD